MKKIFYIFTLVFLALTVTFNVANAGESARDGHACTMDKMKEMYLQDDTKVDDNCWYCKVVIVLTSAYLAAAKQALPVSVSLGKLCAKLGFMIWLAYYILLQVSSLAPITPFKMMQEILVMGFKVALVCIVLANEPNLVMNTITTYFINPIVGLGCDYGTALLDGLMRSHNIDSAIANLHAH